MSHHRLSPRVTLMLSAVTRLLMLVPLTVLALAASAEAQSQAGGLPDVSERMRVLQTQTTALQTLVLTLQAQAQALQMEAQALQSRVVTLETEKAALQGALAEVQAAVAQEAATRTATLAQIQTSLQAAIALEAATRAATLAQIKAAAEAALAEETQARLTADNDIRAKLDVFGDGGMFSAQFEIVGRGGEITNEFARVLSEFVGPGSYILIATVSNLGGDKLNGSSPAERTCELRTSTGEFIARSAASNHDADTVALVVTGGALAEAPGEEIVLWCRVTNSAFGVTWDGAQMIALKIGGFGEDDPPLPGPR